MNESGERASMLLLFTPGAQREDYFETQAEVGRGRVLSEEERIDPTSGTTPTGSEPSDARGNIGACSSLLISTSRSFPKRKQSS